MRKKATRRAEALDVLAKKLKLNRRQRALAEYLVSHPDARYEDAGRAAGYEGKAATLKVTVCNALKKPGLVAYMDALRTAAGVPTAAERTEAALVTRDEVVAGLRQTIKDARESGDYNVVAKCFELLGKTLANFFQTKVQVSTPAGEPLETVTKIVVEVVDPQEPGT